MSLIVATGATLATACLGGAVAVPSLRKMTFGGIKKHWLNNELNFDYIANDKMTVHLKNGQLVRFYSISGVSYETRPDDEQNNMSVARGGLIHHMSKCHVAVRFFAIKRQRNIAYSAEWPFEALKEIGDAEKNLFSASYHQQWIMSVTAKNGRSLEDVHDKIGGFLNRYKVNVIKEGEGVSPLHDVLNYMVCGEFGRHIKPFSKNISYSLPSSNISIDGKIGNIATFLPEPFNHAVIAVRGWPEIVSGQIIAQIMKLSCEIEICQICLPLNQQRLKRSLIIKANQANAPVIGNISAAEEFETAQDLLKDNEYSFFDTQFQIIVRDKNYTQLQEHLRQIRIILDEFNIAFNNETELVGHYWFNRLPGYDDLARPLRIWNENISALWCFQHSPEGQIKNPLDDRPIRLFKTETGEAYSMQFHTSPAPQEKGHYLIFAPTGSGKSSLLMYLIGGLSKINGFKSFVFDSKEGTRFMIECMGGVYQSYDNLQLNPIDCGDGTPDNKHRAYMLIRSMLGEITITPDIEDEISHAVDLSFSIAPPERTFNNIYPYAFSKNSIAKQAFKKWVIDGDGNEGLYSHIFNSPHDVLSNFLSGSHIVGINMNEVLDDPILSPPIVSHISYAINHMARSGVVRGFNTFIDEGGNLMQNETFAKLALEKYREDRKLNGIVGMAFQEPGGLLQAGKVADSIIDNTSNFFFFPNSQAKKSDYERFKLTDEQLHFILNANQYGIDRRVLLIRRDNATGFDESVILNIDLAPLGKAFRFFKSGPDAVKLMQEKQAEWGDKWRDYI